MRLTGANGPRQWRGEGEAKEVAWAKIFVNVHHSFEVESVTYWFERWQESIRVVNEGGGLRTKIWYVEAPIESLRELPEVVVARIQE